MKGVWGLVPAEVALCHEGGGASACRISFRPPPAKGGGRGVFVYKPWHATAGQGDCGIYLLTTASGNGFVGRYLRPLGLSACGGQEPGEVFPLIVAFQWGALVEAVFLQGCVLLESSSKRRRSFNEVTLIGETDDTQRSAPGAGTPTGALGAKRTA